MTGYGKYSKEYLSGDSFTSALIFLHKVDTCNALKKVISDVVLCLCVVVKTYIGLADCNERGSFALAIFI